VEPSVTIEQVENKKKEHVIKATTEKAEETTVTTIVTKPLTSCDKEIKPKFVTP